MCVCVSESLSAYVCMCVCGCVCMYICNKYVVICYSIVFVSHRNGLFFLHTGQVGREFRPGADGRPGFVADIPDIEQLPNPLPPNGQDPCEYGNVCDINDRATSSHNTHYTSSYTTQCKQARLAMHPFPSVAKHGWQVN